MTITLVWLVLVITAQGPQVAKVPETEKFKSKEECAAFGEKMTPRMEDFARGMVKADWSDDIPVRFHCFADGVPA